LQRSNFRVSGFDNPAILFPDFPLFAGIYTFAAPFNQPLPDREKEQIIRTEGGFRPLALCSEKK